uniref:Uncharacterized protein n=1 Tax=Meloidogyne enterolobii TaxID=390850 RepID=A0A6V7XKI9_MELEN|nr:unnamed protein product [Meloidogyne enterolobii]
MNVVVLERKICALSRLYNGENIERLVLEVKPFNRLPTSSWKALIQARLYVAEYGGPFRLVMGEVFELSTNNFDPPLELRIDQKIFAIKLEMRYINECYREMPLFKDGELEVFALNMILNLLLGFIVLC